MVFKLSLKNHCIQTELKRLYNKKLSQYFKNPSKDLAQEIETLKQLLENLDFSSLRSKFKELAGGYEEDIFLETYDKKVRIKTSSGFVTEHQF